MIISQLFLKIRKVITVSNKNILIICLKNSLLPGLIILFGEKFVDSEKLFDLSFVKYFLNNFSPLHLVSF